VCEFEAEIQGKKVVGVVKERFRGAMGPTSLNKVSHLLGLLVPSTVSFFPANFWFVSFFFLPNSKTTPLSFRVLCH